MKDYYELLRIPRSASDAEIKQAFRRLAILLHPDKNPHPDAPAAFQELNEAYEVLGDPVRRVLYNQMLEPETTIVTQPVFQHRDPAYRRKKDPNYKPRKPEPTAGYILMLKLMPLTTWISWIALVLSFFVWLDYALPRQTLQEEVIETHRTLSHHIMITNKGHSFDILFPLNRNFLREPEITVYTSKLFSFLDKIETRSGSFQFTNVPSVFRNFMFGPLVLLVLSTITVLVPKGETKFNLCIAIVIVFVLTLVFIGQSVW
jgi:curved DNA-binding protein CbpA